MLISIFCPVFSGSTFFCMTLESWLSHNSGLFIGEINRFDAPFNQYRDYDTLMRQSLSRLTAREAILGSPSRFFGDEIASFSELFSQLIGRGHTFIIEDSKHADWHDYISSDVETAFGLEWLNIVLFRHPYGWLRSFTESHEITESQALAEQYCSQYAYYIDNSSQHRGQTIYIDFDRFLIDPSKSKFAVLRRLGFSDSAIDSLPDTNPLRLPNAIGGNLKSYISCEDFPKYLANTMDSAYQSVHSVVDRFFPHESTEHNHEYTIAFIKHTGYPKVRRNITHLNSEALDFSWVLNKLVRENLQNTYSYLLLEAVN